MRVISGRFKGMALATPRQGTRPPTDRTKEAIFSHLDSWGVLDGARVLDLYAGTGALGIEALSRGARELVAVESSLPAAALITKTLGQLRRNRAWTDGLAARVVVRRAEQWAAAPSPRFDLIFLDPPYELPGEECDRVVADLTAHGAAGDGTVIVLARSGRSAGPTAPDGWTVTQRRDYGETAVYYLERADD